ncbi:MAG: hypothetical protein HY722_03985 [Planctomycetes bacterium]|nr:hypothetical protein [Planctomycetota bacterium]
MRPATTDWPRRPPPPGEVRVVEEEAGPGVRVAVLGLAGLAPAVEPTWAQAPAPEPAPPCQTPPPWTERPAPAAASPPRRSGLTAWLAGSVLVAASFLVLVAALAWALMAHRGAGRGVALLADAERAMDRAQFEAAAVALQAAARELWAVEASDALEVAARELRAAARERAAGVALDAAREAESRGDLASALTLYGEVESRHRGTRTAGRAASARHDLTTRQAERRSAARSLHDLADEAARRGDLLEAIRRMEELSAGFPDTEPGVLAARDLPTLRERRRALEAEATLALEEALRAMNEGRLAEARLGIEGVRDRYPHADAADRVTPAFAELARHEAFQRALAALAAALEDEDTTQARARLEEAAATELDPERVERIQGALDRLELGRFREEDADPAGAIESYQDAAWHLERAGLSVPRPLATRLRRLVEERAALEAGEAAEALRVREAATLERYRSAVAYARGLMDDGRWEEALTAWELARAIGLESSGLPPEGFGEIAARIVECRLALARSPLPAVSIKVVALTLLADTAEEWAHMREILETGLPPGSTVVELGEGGEAGGEWAGPPLAERVATALEGADAFLVPEQERAEAGRLEALGRALGGPLDRFVRGGGVVVGCAEWGSTSGFLGGAGLLGFEARGAASECVVAEPGHPLVAGLGEGTVPEGDALEPIRPGGDARTIVATADGSAAVALREVGEGAVVYLGWDYYAPEPVHARLLLNAVTLRRPAAVRVISAARPPDRVLAGVGVRIIHTARRAGDAEMARARLEVLGARVELMATSDTGNAAHMGRVYYLPGGLDAARGVAAAVSGLEELSPTETDTGGGDPSVFLWMVTEPAYPDGTSLSGEGDPGPVSIPDLSVLAGLPVRVFHTEARLADAASAAALLGGLGARCSTLRTSDWGNDAYRGRAFYSAPHESQGAAVVFLLSSVERLSAEPMFYATGGETLDVWLVAEPGSFEVGWTGFAPLRLSDPGSGHIEWSLPEGVEVVVEESSGPVEEGPPVVLGTEADLEGVEVLVVYTAARETDALRAARVLEEAGAAVRARLTTDFGNEPHAGKVYCEAADAARAAVVARLLALVEPLAVEPSGVGGVRGAAVIVWVVRPAGTPR